MSETLPDIYCEGCGASLLFKHKKDDNQLFVIHSCTAKRGDLTTFAESFGLAPDELRKALTIASRFTWTDERPTQPGYYCFKHPACWPLYFVHVSLGDWRLSQNPEWLYCAGLPDHVPTTDMRNGPLSEVHGKWFGPIPEPGQ